MTGSTNQEAGERRAVSNGSAVDQSLTLKEGEVGPGATAGGDKR